MPRPTREKKVPDPFFLMGLLCIVLCISGCQPLLCQLPAELRKERWRITGHVFSKRVKGQRVDVWIAVLDFPQKKVTRLISIWTPAPDGWIPVGWSILAYNETSQVMILSAARGEFLGILLYDHRNKKGKWIGAERWHGVSSFAWSPHGKKLAFMATDNPDMSAPRCGSVYVYDIPTDKLVKVANDGVVGYYGTESGSPVWNKDGTYLYYPSIHRKLTRIELATFRRETFQVVVDCVLAINNDEIVYVRTRPDATQGNLEARVIKSRLRPEHGESDVVVIYTGVQLLEKIVSPSGRFILMTDRRGYGHGWNVLVDTKTHKVYKYIGTRYIPSLFRISTTSFSK